ncbi:uncharacterized protein LOC122659549 [Telopea speciosissima]|uniref:uncharacterized protein LOC122659549 n=1 Tax=Telopea speciosissima TaxID=54955 RepID=UPI001CC4DD1E|nr:uncharacterized protein LOC122659549 [Telopea speciosissima]
MADAKSSTGNFNIQITSVKLNGASNYLLWSQGFEVYITARRKMKYLTMEPLQSTDDKYDDWKGVWEELKESYSQDTNLCRIYDLYKKFFSFKQDGKSLGEYYSSLKGMWEELNVYQPISTDAAVIKSQRSEFLVAKFLSGLDSDLQSITSQLLIGEKIPSMNEAYCRLQRVISPSVVKFDSAPTDKDNSALFTSTGGRGRGGGSTSSRDRGSNFGRGRGAGSGGRGTMSNTASSGSVDASSRWCTHCNRSNHTVDKCWLKHGKPQWAREQFTNSVVSDGGADSVHSSDTAPGSSTDGGNSSNDLVSQLLQRVLQLETSSSTSTAVLAHSGTTACFASSSSPWVIDSGASSHMIDKPNLFSSYTQPSMSSRISIADGSSIPINRKVSLSSDISLTNVLHVPKLPLNLLSDLATKMKIGGGYEKGGLYYFDLGTTSTAAVATSPGFYNEIRVQFGVSLKTLRTDNALELIQREASQFCSDNGILHQTFCSYTSQQNGVAERKNRHLLDVTRSLMFHMHVPKLYWANAVLIAYFLINRMPSSILHNQITFNIVFSDRAVFSLPPRVFGCHCFIHVLRPGLDKLSSWAVKCLFLGYSRTQKGYRCFDPVTHQQFISADVTFFESSPYFAGSSVDVNLDEVGRVAAPAPLPPLPLPIAAPPVQVYVRRHQQQSLLPLQPIAATPLPPPADSLTVDPPVGVDDLPIAQRKGTRTCTTRPLYPLANYVSISHLSLHYCAFATALHSTFIPTFYTIAMSHPKWKNAMDVEMEALISRKTWSLVDLPPGKDLVKCHWVYTVRYNPDGTVEQHKARLVAKGRQGSNVVILAIYVDDIIITGNDASGIAHFGASDDTDFSDPHQYRCLVGRLIYLTVTRLDISFVVGVISQFMQTPKQVHWEAACRILRYLKGAPGKGLVYHRQGHTSIVGFSDAA